MAQAELKVVVLIPTLEVGGTESQVIQLLPHLRRGVDICLLARRKGELLGIVQRMAIYSGSLSKSKVLFVLSAVGKLVFWSLSPNKKVIAEAFLPGPIILASLAKLLSGNRLTVIANRRSHLFYRGNSMLRDYLDRWSSKFVDLTVCNSPSIANELIELGEVEQSRLRIIPNALSLPSMKFEKQISSASCQIHVVSNHHKYKRVDDILFALEALREQGKVPKVHIYGEGSETKKLKELALRLNLDNVTFEGLILDPWSKANSGDLFVHASETEGFSNAVLEAMSRGLCCVLSDISANRFVAAECARYFSVGNHDEMMEEIDTLLRDPDTRRKLGQRAQERVREVFSVEMAVARRIEIYKELTSDRHE